MRQHVAYYRVSTKRQGASGLGLDAQRSAVDAFVRAEGGEVVAEFQDVESGKHSDRPQLAAALAHAKRIKARLVIAKLDRLSRSVAFVAQLMEAGVPFVAVDNPNATELTIHILAAVAQDERKNIGIRTKAALQAAKLRGVKLGSPKLAEAREQAVGVVRAGADAFAARVLPIIQQAQQAGATSLRQQAEALNRLGIKTRRGSTWTAHAVRQVLQRQAPATA